MCPNMSKGTTGHRADGEAAVCAPLRHVRVFLEKDSDMGYATPCPSLIRAL